MKNNGGPAFPHVERPVGWDSRGDVQTIERWTQGGMSLRDYFIAHAPAQEIADLVPTNIKGCAEYLGIDPAKYTVGDYLRVLAKARGQWADAMLLERDK